MCVFRSFSLCCGLHFVVPTGPIGVEMAQALQRLGSSVTIVDMLDRVLRKARPCRLELTDITLCDVRPIVSFFVMSYTVDCVTGLLFSSLWYLLRSLRT